ncbi:MAG: CdaR family protein [Pyrinomonadaceae bacterium]|nr:CdaR family protein [Pyrinomonadaceae bacterium]
MRHETASIKDGRISKALVKQIARKIFLEDWLIKLVALAVTLALWLGVTGLSEPIDRRLSGVPLTLQFSSDMELTNAPVQQVTVIVTGDKRIVSPINGNDLLVSVDLTGLQPGERVIQLMPENVRIGLPTGVKVKEIQPNRIAVKLELVEQKELDVQVETSGEPAEGYEVYSRSAIPAKVRVRGPASYVRSLTMVSTEKIELAGATQDLTVRQVPLVMASSEKTTLIDSYVDVMIKVGEKRMERIYLVPAADGKRATVVLYGPRSTLLAIEAEDLRIENADDGNGGTEPRVVLPQQAGSTVEIRKFELGR